MVTGTITYDALCRKTLKEHIKTQRKIVCHSNSTRAILNVEVVGHEAHYHQRLYLEAWMSVKDPNAGNDHMVIPEVYKCLART